MEEKNVDIIGLLNDDLAKRSPEEIKAIEANRSRGATELYRRIDCAHHAALHALSGAVRLLMLCDLNEEMQSAIKNDPECVDLKGDITVALCALSGISPQWKERIALAMQHSSVLFDLTGGTLYPDELNH